LFRSLLLEAVRRLLPTAAAGAVVLPELVAVHLVRHRELVQLGSVLICSFVRST
jgi:hypothetical protein